MMYRARGLALMFESHPHEGVGHAWLGHIRVDRGGREYRGSYSGRPHDGQNYSRVDSHDRTRRVTSLTSIGGQVTFEK
jgi:hypothetical protein